MFSTAGLLIRRYSFQSPEAGLFDGTQKQSRLINLGALVCRGICAGVRTGLNRRQRQNRLQPIVLQTELREFIKRR
jgi:hypothetical protein